MASKKMKIRAWIDGDFTVVKAIIFHPMETGLRKDKATNKPIPAHYITEVDCENNGKNILTCHWGPGVSKNPFLSFRYKGAKKGDTFKIAWVDNKGEKGTQEVKIK